MLSHTARTLLAASLLFVGASADSIVLTLGGENGGVGVSAIQCNQGVLTAQVNLQASINVNNIHDYQPMAETGLPTVTGTFAVNGAPATVSVLNSFNVQSASASGSNWIFQLQDDGPHPGGQFSLGSCTAGTTPDIKISFSSGPITDAAGLPNGADGGPPVPAVNGPVTVVNALPAQFNGGANGAVVTAAATTTVAAIQTAAAAVANGAITTVTLTVAANTMLVIVTNTPSPVATAAAVVANVVAANNVVAAATATAAIVYTFTMPGSISAQCNNGVVQIFNVGFQQSVSINGGAPSQPMAETGLTTIHAAFFVNGAAATSGQLTSSYNMDTPSVTGNVLSWTMLDDQPNPGAALTLTPATACTSGGNLAVSIALSADPVTNALNVNGPVSVVNNLPAANNAGTGSGSGSSAVVPIIPTTTAAAIAAATGSATAGTAGSIVLTLAGENNGDGVTNIQCNQGVLNLQVVLQASVNVNNIHAYQPMAETGLPTVTATFSVNGAPPTVTLLNSFNVQSGSASGANWIFQLQDDGPHPGGQFSLGSCTAGTTPDIKISFSSGPITDAAGLPNGADGGPPVPAVNGPVTVVNALPAQFNGGATGGSAATGGAAVVTATTAATAAVTTAATTGNTGAGTSGTGTHISTVNVKPNLNSANCGGPSNSNLLLYMGTTISSTVTGVANTACTNGPMAECGLPLLQGTVFFAANNSAVNIISWNGGNQVFSGNTMQIQEEDDMPYYGGTLVLNLPCSFATANFNSDIANQLSFKFTSLQSTVDSLDQNGNPVTVAVSVLTVV
ncbi:hypothetical protein HDU83_008529 [Entophlyctis luteolus]|nr:hypothetical protein HDU83_008529 [Entophlyctis luteolus]